MPNPNGSFQGQPLIVPYAYYADNVSAVQPATPTDTPPLIFLGYGYGVKPQTPTQFSNASQLLAAVRGGPCSGFIPFLTNPSPQLAGAQLITFINVGANTQSTLNLLSSGGATVLALTSVNYGLPSNQLQIQVAAGSIAGRNISLYDLYSNVSTPTGINLGVPFQLAYTGSATGVTYGVVTSGGVATTLYTTSPNAGESVSISLLPSNFATVEGVVNYLNGTGFYSAIVISNGLLPSSNLDAASGVALASGAALSYANVWATLGDIAYWFNQYANTINGATAIVSGVSSSGVIPAILAPTLFTGATSTPPTNSSYASGFNAALNTTGWAVFADSNAAAVVALGTQHAVTASQTQYGRWRRFFSGSSIGDSVSGTIAVAQAQGAISTCYAYPGFYAVSPITGQNTLYSGLYAAACAAGMATGNPVPTPLTNKSIYGTGLEVNLSLSNINILQQAGVMCIIPNIATGAPTIASDLTTWQNDSNPENIFTQQVACRWSLAYQMQGAMQAYVGTVAAALNETNILNAAKQVLNNAIYSSSNINGVISSWNPNSLQLVYTGNNQTASISVSVTLVGQNRFITIYVPVQPLNITISSSITGQVGGTPV